GLLHIDRGGDISVDPARLPLALEDVHAVLRGVLLRVQLLLPGLGSAELGGRHRRSGERNDGAGGDDECTSVHLNSSWLDRRLQSRYQEEARVPPEIPRRGAVAETTVHRLQAGR